MYTAISINDVGKALQAFETRPNGGLRINLNFAQQCGGNLQVCTFASEIFVFPLIRPFSVAFPSLLYGFQFRIFFLNFRVA